jgi:hypothetical protein
MAMTLLPTPAGAQAREADKARPIRQIFESRKFEIEFVLREQDRPFCRAFLDDFALQSGVEFVEPDLRSDSYDDPAWQPYRARCPNLGLFDSYACEPRIAQSIERMPKEQRDAEYKSACRHYRGTANFKHYLVDLDNNPADGKEHVVYYERAEGPLNRPETKPNFANGGYWVIDVDRCETKGGALTNDPYSYFYARELRNYNGIIRYAGKHYIFDLYELATKDPDPKNTQYSLRLDGYARFPGGARPRLGPICSYSTVVLNRK